MIAGSRTKLTDAATFYVRSDGSDLNSGAANDAAGAFASIQGAYNAILQGVDTSGLPVKIKVADGASASGFVSSAPLVGGGKLIIEGNFGAPANCSVSTSSTYCFQILDGDVLVRGFRVSTTGAFNCFDVAGGHLAWDRIDFGPSGSNHVQCYLDGAADCFNATYTISGGAGAHLHCYGGGRINLNSTAVTLVNTPAFRDAFVGVASAIVGCAGVTFSGAATGRRYGVHKNGIIDIGSDNEAFFPGSTPGTRYGGGKYTGEPEGRQAWAATAFASSGALAQNTVVSTYQRSEGYIDVEYFLPGLNAGSGSGALVLVLPFPASGHFVAFGYRLNDGAPLFGSGGPGTASLSLLASDGGPAVANGSAYRIQARYAYQ